MDEYWLNEAKTFNDTTRTMIGEIENKIKIIISDNLEDYFGDAWLVKGLPKNVYTKAKKLADEKMYDLLSTTMMLTMLKYGILCHWQITRQLF